MAEFIRSTLVRDRASATEDFPLDLPTNPISHLIISISGQQIDDEATLAEILAFINTVTVSRLGVTVLSMQSEDLYALNCYLYRKRPTLTNRITTDTHARTLGLIVPFGRRIYDPEECHPATDKGDLTLHVNTTVMAGSIEAGIMTIECVQLPGATPTRYLKSVMRTVQAPGALGENDVSLPIGNDIAAIQIRSITHAGAASHVYGVEDARVLRSEEECGYVSSRMQGLIAENTFRVDGQSSTMLLQQQRLPECTVWLDYDPNTDGKWLLQTQGASALTLRLNMGVNEQCFVTPLELQAC